MGPEGSENGKFVSHMACGWTDGIVSNRVARRTKMVRLNNPRDVIMVN